MNEFINRTGLNLNRKILKVISEADLNNEGGYEKEIIVDEFRDEENIVGGTKLTAENMNNIVNNLAEAKVFEIFRTLETTLDGEMNSITFDEAVMNTYTLPTETELGAKITWEAASDNVQVNGNVVTVTRRINDTNGTLKGTFILGYMQKSKLITIPIKGTNDVELNIVGVSTNWMQGVDNSLEYEIETLDSSKLEYDLNEIYTDNHDEIEFLNLIITRINDKKIKIKIVEGDLLKNSSSNGTDIFEFNINLYIDNKSEENKRTLSISITYNYASTTPED